MFEFGFGCVFVHLQVRLPKTCSIGKQQLWVLQTVLIPEVFSLSLSISLQIILLSHPRYVCLSLVCFCFVNHSFFQFLKLILLNVAQHIPFYFVGLLLCHLKIHLFTMIRILGMLNLFSRQGEGHKCAVLLKLFVRTQYIHAVCLNISMYYCSHVLNFI